ncbi:MAG: hypothetical protein JO360_05425 [Acidobacteria bacterium]|nr:hypothetical protein [Acidobacteriota bacterium]
MRLSEAITIYLAIGAPFGVSYFLRGGRRQKRTRAFLKSTGALLLWPVTATIFLFLPPPAALKLAETTTNHQRAREVEKIEQAQSEMLAALYRVAELAARRFTAGDETRERAVREVRESIEGYAGLTLAAAHSSADAPPSKRDMELCRVAGRTGADLLIAGRCTHRRNHTRLISHQARSRTTLLHALADLRELANDERADSSENLQVARQLSVAFLKFYGRAINLFSLLEDERAARAAARLLEAECARLQRLEALDREAAPATFAGEESCTHAHHSAFNHARSQRTPLMPG